jgi:hypothetical protein
MVEWREIFLAVGHLFVGPLFLARPRLALVVLESLSKSPQHRSMPWMQLGLDTLLSILSSLRVIKVFNAYLPS